MNFTGTVCSVCTHFHSAAEATRTLSAVLGSSEVSRFIPTQDLSWTSTVWLLLSRWSWKMGMGKSSRALAVASALTPCGTWLTSRGPRDSGCGEKFPVVFGSAETCSSLMRSLWLCTGARCREHEAVLPGDCSGWARKAKSCSQRILTFAFVTVWCIPNIYFRLTAQKTASFVQQVYSLRSHSRRSKALSLHCHRFLLEVV